MKRRRMGAEAMVMLLLLAMCCVSSKELRVRVVEDPYDEEGITIRHYGKLANLPAVNQSQLAMIARSFRGGFVDFSAWNGRDASDTSRSAYCLALRTAIFLLDPVLRDALARPEQLTYKLSPEQPVSLIVFTMCVKPRLDPEDPERHALIRWEASWPEPNGWRGWKVFLALQDFQEHADSVLLLDTSFGNTWSVELLELLGLPKDRCLVSPSTQSHPTAQGVSDAADKIAQASPDRRWFLSRQRCRVKLTLSISSALGGCKVREIVNAEEVMAGIRKTFSSYHLVPFDSTGMSCREQVRVFASAHVVIGTHGAGLTNVMFAPSGARVIEFLPFLLLQSSVSLLPAHQRAATLTTIPPESMVPDDATSLHNFRVPVENLLLHLGKLLQ
ncbi:hypothetical protein GUITHDRAFT_141724 [Guillardia theta CCMP2712]|uniref:Glycosyltransferase 61 catalytic domain-containing protein n=1 Tax=Guillardia theta (strain CCMP2712) TaxID=905079 RepID=L1J075_GUITC|nr:hypothetical protein GUITHDRAFT_141724 [Guillardia theta CCMP2712]EKX41722.1 hypothetical protein GUITHDRAFT_141724 [Guillardia theta CCMP2712]|eukprot:XP_005828702.1 hypothetical protein GUITHDRAFT_141724 [Guillardia theta CCMP2712]